MTKVLKKKTFPTRRGAINFAKTKAEAKLPYWDMAIIPDKKGRLVEVKVFVVEYIGRQ